MDRDISKKSTNDKGSERAKGRAPGGEYQPLPFGPETEMLALHSAIGNQAVGRLLRSDGAKLGMIQARLTVSQPGDKHEQKADRIANQVMRIPDRAGADEAQSATTVQTQFVQPKGSTEQAAPLAHGDYAPKSDFNRNGGEPLPEETRAFMELRFKRDFSQVRIHSGPRANTFARMLGARAFTQGPDIVFGAGEFQPTSTTGQRLLAHELAHVGQQAHGQAMPIIQRMPLDEALAEGRTFRVTQITGLVLHGEGNRVTVDELIRLDLEELETLHKNMKDAFRYAQTEKDKENVRSFISERFTPALKRKLLLNERKQRRLEARRLQREAKKRRLTGEDPPKSVDELLTQLSVAMEHATAEPPNFSAAVRILTHCDKWLRQIVSSNNYYKHWQQLEGNRTEAEALIYRASAEVTFLLSQARSHAKDEKPVSIENWQLSISIVEKAQHYLQILSDQPTSEAAQLASSVKRANEIKGGVLLTAASLPFVAMFSAEVLVAAGAEIAFLARLAPVFLRSPSAAAGLLRAQIMANPEAWYEVFGALMMTGAAVVTIGFEEFAERATTPSGAMELAFQILQIYLQRGAGPAKQARRRSPVSVGEEPETPAASPSANATSASTAPKAPPSHQSPAVPPPAGEGSLAAKHTNKPPSRPSKSEAPPPTTSSTNAPEGSGHQVGTTPKKRARIAKGQKGAGRFVTSTPAKPPPELVAIRGLGGKGITNPPSQTGIRISTGAYSAPVRKLKTPEEVREAERMGFGSSQGTPITAKTKVGINKAIRPEIAERQAWDEATVKRKEIGLQGPTGSFVEGPDFITARERGDGKIEIIVTDVASTEKGKLAVKPTKLKEDWRNHVESAISEERLGLGDPDLEARIRDAFREGRVSRRQINVDFTPSGQGRTSGW
jgi:hypothetical protein